MVMLAGALLALAVMCRPPTVIFAGLFALYVVRRHRRQVLASLPLPLALAGLLLAYNLYYFATPSGGYTGAQLGFVFSWAQVSIALPGLLVSPNRGLLVFSPVVLPAFAGIAAAFRIRGEPMLGYLGLGVMLTIAFYACYADWDGGFSYSYRLLVDLLPALALLAAPTWAWLSGRRWRRWAIGGVAAFSIGIQVVGAF